MSANTKATQWNPWPAGNVRPCLETALAIMAWGNADEWLYGCGITFNEEPKAWARSGKVGGYLFQLDGEGGEVVVEVEIDEDPPARAVRVEVRRG